MTLEQFIRKNRKEIDRRNMKLHRAPHRNDRERRMFEPLYLWAREQGVRFE